MPRLDLTNEEAETLRETIQSTLKNLSYEIADTDSMDYREGLKQKRDVLARLEQQLGRGEGGA